ncbi:hypothetical protein ANCDUO_03895 [Ancylostoma duodenale]|uniref:Uncharacterized protein n=1 Tax=Ancylostoma duodenale TaxID=51022 RepID=A0A0C2D7W4_9BILA|nr:hypothetical protein ANCDUO_03895 [Ancylostoma duodenale]
MTPMDLTALSESINEIRQMTVRGHCGSLGEQLPVLDAVYAPPKHNPFDVSVGYRDVLFIRIFVNPLDTPISPKNYNCFQDHVEVHMRQVHNVMLKSGAATS